MPGTDMPRVVTTREFARELADVGIIPYSMMDSITGFKIVCDPANFVMLQLDVVLDERIFKIINPRVRKMFTVDVQPQMLPSAIKDGKDV